MNVRLHWPSVKGLRNPMSAKQKFESLLPSPPGLSVSHIFGWTPG